MFKQINLFVLATLVLCGFLKVEPVKAQDELPPWKNLNCNYPQKYKGLEYCTGMAGKARVIIVDLTDPDIRLQYLIASGKDRNGNTGPCKDVNLPPWSSGPGCYDPKNSNFYPVFSLFDAIKSSPNAAVIINTDYGAYTSNDPSTRGHGPEGLTIINGARIDGKKVKDTDDNAVNRPWLAFGLDPVHAEIGQWTSDDGLNPDWMYTAVGGAPWLIKDGQVRDDDIKTCKGAKLHSCESSVAQTAVGLSQGPNPRWLYFVLIVGTDAKGIAKFMDEQLKAQQAIKFDGGGSSQIYYAGLPEAERTYRVDGRWLSQYLGILAQSGNGIELNSTPPSSEPPSESDLSWWQNIQKKWNDFWNGVGTWWQDQKQNVSDWLDGIKTWWQDLPQRIEDWLLQQFMDWLNQTLNQLCGSAGLIPVTMALAIYAYKRYHTK